MEDGASLPARYGRSGVLFLDRLSSSTVSAITTACMRPFVPITNKNEITLAALRTGAHIQPKGAQIRDCDESA